MTARKPKPKKRRLLTDELIELSKPKLVEMFGPRTCLGKFDPAPCKETKGLDLWQVITLKEVGSYAIRATGPNARRALENADLEGWIKDREDEINEAEGKEAAR